MNRQNQLSSAGKLTITGLVLSAIGVVIQIVSGHPYPTVPPVFFILLIPASLIAFGRWRWLPISAVLAGLFLTFGLFASGQSGRLINFSKFGDSVGLWIQMLSVIVATIAAIITTIQNYANRPSVTEGRLE